MPEQNNHSATCEQRGEREAAIVEKIGTRSIVLVGLMGSGKSTVGKRLATRLGLNFSDADDAIEQAAGLKIPEIFERHGEAYFRAGEQRVIARLLTQGPQVLATGGGAYMNAETRKKIAEHGLSIWLKTDFDVLMRRVRRRSDRPLLSGPNPEETMHRLINERYPIYAEAELVIPSLDVTHEVMVETLVSALAHHLCSEMLAPPNSPPSND